jgi:hypothetical protein
MPHISVMGDHGCFDVVGGRETMWEMHVWDEGYACIMTRLI